MWLCTRCHRRASFGAGSSDSARRLASGAHHLEHRFCTWGNARAKVRLSQRHCHSLVSWALVHCQVPATALSWFTMSAMMLSTRGCGLARPGDVPDCNNTLRIFRQNHEPITTVMRTCCDLQELSELTVCDGAFKQLERGLTRITLLVTYVPESSKEVFYVYVYIIRTSSSFSWVPTHDNNAQLRMFIKEAPVSQGLLKGFRH